MFNSLTPVAHLRCLKNHASTLRKCLSSIVTAETPWNKIGTMFAVKICTLARTPSEPHHKCDSLLNAAVRFDPGDLGAQVFNRSVSIDNSMICEMYWFGWMQMMY